MLNISSRLAASHRGERTSLSPRGWIGGALFSAAVLLLPLGARAGEPAKKADKRTVISYQSTLKDDDNKPVSGIFPMHFALHKPGSKKTFWKEKHWVAVDNGHYVLHLGRQSALPKELDPKSAVLAVSIPGVGVVLEEALAGGGAAIGQEVAMGGGDGKRIVSYAEKSGFAYEAERAQNADRLGNFTAKLLQDALDELQKRKLKVKVGRNHINLTSVGGVGGTPFEAICPPNMVSVGIRGGAGIYIDNFQVVCAPLE